MATHIRPNRLEVSDRFPMLGFTVRTDGSAKRFEIAIGTSADLFSPEGKSHRSRDNFYSTRASGPLAIDRGEAVFVVPPEVLARFVGQQRLYYGLATFNNGTSTHAEIATMPGAESPYISLSGLTGRSLQRVRMLPSRQKAASSYGKTGSEMEWAGDAAAPGSHPAVAEPVKRGTEKNAPAASEPSPVHYDDGYGPLPVTSVAPAPALQPQAKSLAGDIPLDPGIGGQSIGTSALQIGDIIVSTTGHLTSTVIRVGSGSQVSHAMLYVGQGGQVVEAVGGGVRLIPLADAVSDATVAVAFRVPGMTSDQQQQIADSIAAYIGRDYDYVGVIRQGLFQIDKHVCSILPDGARQNCENWAGRIDLGRGSGTDFFCSSLVTQAFADAGVPITSKAANWNSPQDLVELSLVDRALQYVGHLKAPIPNKSLLDVFGLSLAASASTGQKGNGTLQRHMRKHQQFAHPQGVLDWATGHVADLIREKFKSAQKKPFSFPKISILDGDEEQTLQRALQRGVFANSAGAIQAVLAKEYSVGIGLNAGAGVGVGGAVGAGVVLTSDGHLGVYGEAQINEGMFEQISAQIKITLVKGGVDAFNGLTQSAGIELGAGIGGSIEVLGDEQSNILGVAVGITGGEEIGVFFTQGVGWAVQLFSESSVLANVAGAQATELEFTQSLAAEDPDAAHGIDGPVPEKGIAVQASAQSVAIAPEYPQASRLEPANNSNYHASEGLRTINHVVIHITDGGPKIDGTIAWFKDPAAKVSAHYLVGQDGEVVQMVKHNDVAWHAHSANADSIGIEHVANTKGLNPTPIQYGASAALANWLADRYNIPADRAHILGHSEADPQTTNKGCPNAVWDWDYYMGMVNSASSNDPPTQTQSLSVRLPAPPSHKKKKAKDQTLEANAPRMVANSPVNTVSGGEGNITWELDQFPGVKSALPSPVAPMQSAETIQLSNWPYCDHSQGARACAWFTVDWKFSGQALGHVSISPSGAHPGSQPLRVEARIEEGKDNAAGPVSILVHFTYHFSTADGPEVVAVTDLTLYSDGSIDQKSNWTSRAAA